jgi:hypothetical protein
MRRASVAALLFLAVAAFASDSGTRDSYVLRDGDVTYMLGEGMPAAALKRLQARYGRVFLWARREGRTYVIRDSETLDAARGVMQRNVPARAEQERRIAAVVDSAIRRGTASSVDTPRRDAYLLHDGDTRITISGDSSLDSIRALNQKFSGDYLWVRRAGKEYLIRDPVLLDRMRALFAPEHALAPQQAAIAREEKDLDHEEDALDDDEHDEKTSARLSDIHTRQEDISRRESELDRREEELERQAEAALWPLVDDAIRDGSAVRLQ